MSVQLPVTHINGVPYLLVPGGTTNVGAVAGNKGVTHNHGRDVTVPPFQMMQNAVSVQEFTAYIARMHDRALTYGRIIYGREGHIASILWGNSAHAVENKAVKLNSGQTIDSVFPVSRLVPSIDEYKARFIEGGEVFLNPNLPARRVKYLEAAAYAFMHGGHLPTALQWDYALRAGRSQYERLNAAADDATAWGFNVESFDSLDAVVKKLDHTVTEKFTPMDYSTFLSEWCHELHGSPPSPLFDPDFSLNEGEALRIMRRVMYNTYQDRQLFSTLSGASIDIAFLCTFRVAREV